VARMEEEIKVYKVLAGKSEGKRRLRCRWEDGIRLHLTRGPGRLLPSDLAPILQYGSRPPSDFLVKILGVDTSPFLWNTRFYFTRSYL
jgi:hypothetical protein